MKSSKNLIILVPIVSFTIIFAGGGYLTYRFVFQKKERLVRVVPKKVEAVSEQIPKKKVNKIGGAASLKTARKVALSGITSKQGYATIPFKLADDGRIVIPIITSFPHKGSDVIVGTQMFIATRNYFKELRHAIKDADGNEYQFYFELKGNNGFTDAQGFRTIRDLLEKSPIVMGHLETELLERLEPLIKEKKALVLFPGDGDSKFRKKGYKNVVYFRPTLEQELKALVHYLIKESDKRKCAIFYEASIWGENVHKKLRNILGGSNIEIVATGSYPQGSVEVGNALREISKSAPNIVFCLAKPRPAYSFIKNAVSKGLHNCLFFGLSDLNVIQKLLSQTKVSDEVIVSSLVPHPQSQTMAVTKQYHEIMKSFLSFRASSPFFIETFVTCELLVAAISRLKKEELTIENIIDQLKSIMNEPFKDFSLPAGQRPIWINPGVNKPWEKGIIHNGRVTWHTEKN